MKKEIITYKAKNKSLELRDLVVRDEEENYRVQCRLVNNAFLKQEIKSIDLVLTDNKFEFAGYEEGIYDSTIINPAEELFIEFYVDKNTSVKEAEIRAKNRKWIDLSMFVIFGFIVYLILVFTSKFI